MSPNRFLGLMNLPAVGLNVGDTFNSMQELKGTCKAYSIQNAFEFTPEKSDKTRYTICCKADGCTWCLHASSVKCSQLYCIKTFNSEHTCFGTNSLRHTQADNSFLAQHLADKLKEQPS